MESLNRIAKGSEVGFCRKLLH